MSSSTWLDRDEGWKLVRNAAIISHKTAHRHSSPNRDRPYRILSVSKDKIIVERIGRDGKPQQRPLTRKAVSDMIDVLNKHPGGCQRLKLKAHYYKTNIFIELHPRLRLENSDLVTIIPNSLKGDSSIRGGSNRKVKTNSQITHKKKASLPKSKDQTNDAFHANTDHGLLGPKAATPAAAVERSYILCWNPKQWEWPEFRKQVNRSAKGQMIHGRWSTGRTKTISDGERIYLYRQAVDRGIIASGWTSSNNFMDDHWNGSAQKIPYVKVVFDRIVAPDDALPVEGLIRRVPNVKWNRIRASGNSLHKDDASKVEALWLEHLKGLGICIAPTEIATPALYIEGASRVVAVNAYERNAKARENCKKHHGVTCTVCGFNFDSFYGEIGTGFIHVHHLKDLATVGGEYVVDPVRDLRPVCPNCHAMLHTETPAISIKKLRRLVAAQRRQT